MARNAAKCVTGRAVSLMIEVNDADTLSGRFQMRRPLQKEIWRETQSAFCMRFALTFALVFFLQACGGEGICSGGCGVGLAAYSSKILTDKPFAYWPLNETSGTTAFDISGSGFHGTFSGAGYALGIAGPLAGPQDLVNTAVNFTGTGQVLMGNLGNVPTVGTIEFWFNSSAVEDYRNVFCTGGVGSATVGFRFEQTTAGLFSTYVGSNLGSYNAYHFTRTLLPNTWYHVVLEWDTSSNGLWGFLNGSLVFFVQTHVNWASTMNDVRIGTGFHSSRNFKGTVDEVAVYDKKLSDTQVQEHYLIGTTP